MRDREGGFTLIEVVIAVAIAAILLAAGGAWMLSMRPGALRGAANDFDGALAAARQVAATSGNGATLAFLPKNDGTPGFELHVYSGRPTSANAVITTTIRSVVSAATVSEATYGSPPFSLFLSSAGYPTGQASYPVIDDGVVSFPAIARQPPCPSGGIVLTFRAPQGATATRTLQCNVVAAGNAVAYPSPTPNGPHIMPPQMVAHWTNDRGGALKFEVAEFGYTGPYSKADDACDAIATFAATPVTASAAQNPDEPVADFELYPIPGQPGLCTVGVNDSYGQTVHSNVQVMGDLTRLDTNATSSLKVGDVVTLQFGKRYDSEKLLLQAGGNCKGIVNASLGATNAPPAPSLAYATAQLVITATAPGACVLDVGDQYGEPVVTIPINVAAPFATWPEMLKLGTNNSRITYAPAPRGFDIAAVLNGVVAGGIARAASLTPGCYAAALKTDGVTPDYPIPPQVRTFADSRGIYLDPTGCLVDAHGTPVNGTAAVIAYEPSGTAVTYSTGPVTSCTGGPAYVASWNPSPPHSVIDAALRISAGSNSGSCTVAVSDGSSQTPSISHGLADVETVNTTVIQFLQTSCMGGAAGPNWGCPIENADTSYTWQPNWTAFILHLGSGDMGLHHGACDQWGWTSDAPPIRICEDYAPDTYTPSDAIPFCQFETKSISPPGGNASTMQPPVGWDYYLNGTMESISNPDGYSCSDITIGSIYRWTLVDSPGTVTGPSN